MHVVLLHSNGACRLINVCNKTLTPTHTHTHSPTLTHTHTHTLTQTHTHSRTPHTHTHSRARTHTPTHTLTPTHTPSHSHTHTKPTHTHPHLHIHTHTPTLTHTHTHSLSLHQLHYNFISLFISLWHESWLKMVQKLPIFQKCVNINWFDLKNIHASNFIAEIRLIYVTARDTNEEMRDFRLPSRCKWYLHSSGISCSLVTDVSVQAIGPFFKGRSGTDRLSRNVGN